MSFDPADIGAVVTALYTALSGPAGERDWSLQDRAFHPDARLIRTGVDEFGAPWLKIMTLQQYRDDVALFLSKIPFYESETDRRVEMFGNIAQVWSAYEEKRDPASAHVERRGINSIQLVRDEHNHWRIISVTWDNARAGMKVG